MKYLKTFEKNINFKKYIILEKLYNYYDVYEIKNVSKNQVLLILWYSYNSNDDILKQYSGFNRFNMTKNEIEKVMVFESDTILACLEYTDIIKNIKKYNL